MTARTPTALFLGAFLLILTSDQGSPARSQLRHKPPDPLPAPLLSDPVLPDTTALIGKYIAEHIQEFATPEFHARKKIRREFQRTGYTNVLHDVLALDAVSALLSFIRTRLQIEYSLPNNTIFFRTDAGALMPLPEDWKFPADPWTD